jgi:antirestriction protein
MSNTPRIWVGCLASYNAGILFGEWMDADDGEDEVNEQIAALLRRSPSPNVVVECPDCANVYGPPTVEADCKTCKGSGEVPSAEEFHICDHENFGGYEVARYSSISEVCKAGALIEQHGEAFGAACAAFDESEVEQVLEERYRGVWDSAADYAEEFAEDTGSLTDIPDQIKWCIDWSKYADSMELIEVRVNGSVHIFDRY